MNDTLLSTVYSYGGANALFYIFNAIAMLFNNGFVLAMINLSVALGLMWAALKSAITRDHHRHYLRWFMSYLFIMLVIIPHNGGMTMHLRDVVTKKAYKIDNLPPGLVIPASFISAVGYSVTKNFETVFSVADSNYLPYHQYGTLFGAQVASEYANFKIQDPILRENMESYINNCIMYDVMIGRSYDIAELKNSPNIIKLVTDNASSLRMFNYRLPKSSGRELKTCKEGIGQIVTSFEGEPTLLSTKFSSLSLGAGNDGSHNNSHNNNLGNKLLKALDVTMKFYDGGQGMISAVDQLKQLLLINAFKHAPSNYETVRAAQTQNTTWRITGEMAKQTLPIMHAVFAALIYGSFPIILCLILFPGGFSSFSSYFGMMIWIELWAPLFAILNLIVSVFARSSNQADVTIQNLDTIVTSSSNYAFAASSLGMLIPVLSYMIIKGGAAQFVHIASQLSSATFSGVNMATSELTTGNKSLDNIQIGNRSSNNVSANKYDNSGFINASGYIRQVLSDGTIQTDYQNQASTRIYQGGAGITSSTGDATINESQTTQNSLHKQIQDSRSIIASKTEEYADTKQSLERQAVDYVSKMAQAESKGERFDISDTTEEGKRLATILNDTKELHDNYNYTWQQAAQMSLNGSMGVSGGTSGGRGIGAGIIGKGTKGGIVNFGAEGKVSADGSGLFRQEDNQVISENHSIKSDKQVAENIDAVARASKNIHYDSTNVQEKSLSENLSHTYESMQSQRNAIAMHQNKQEQAQRSLDLSTSDSFNVGQNRYDELLNHIARKPDPLAPSFNIGTKRAHEIIERGGEGLALHLKTFDSKYQTREAEELADMKSFREQYKNIMTQNDINYSDEKQKPECRVENTTQAFKDEQQKSHFANFDVDGSQIKQEVEQRKERATTQIAEQKQNIQDAGDKIKSEVDKAESNKSLPVKIARAIGVNIGRENPNKGTKWSESGGKE